MRLLVFLSLIWVSGACPSEDPLILSSHAGQLVCNRTSCPNVTCVGYLDRKGETCYSWTCVPVKPSIPPPYTHMYLHPVSTLEALEAFVSLLLLLVLSPLVVVALFLGGPGEFDS